jgi:hypothetical protein
MRPPQHNPEEPAMFDGPWESCMMVRGLNPSECASWVQAWGTVIAIIVSAAIAVLVQQHSVRREREIKREEEIRLLRLIGQYVFEIRAKLRHIETHQIPFLHDNWTAIEGPISSIQAIPLEKHPSERAAFSISIALVTYQFTRNAYATIKPNSMVTREQAEQIEKSLRETVTKFFAAEQMIHKALLERTSELLKTEIGFEDGIVIRTLEPDPV